MSLAHYLLPYKKVIGALWAYILPDVYVSMDDTDTELTLNFPSVEYLEFAVTSEAPGDYKTDIKYLSFYTGNGIFAIQNLQSIFIGHLPKQQVLL